MQLKDFFKNIINRFMNMKKKLPLNNQDEYTEILDSIDVLGLSRELEKNISQDLENKIKAYNRSDIYHYPLKSKISQKDSIEIVKSFFASIDNDISIKIDQILSNTSNNAYVELGLNNGQEEANASNPNKKPVRVFVPIKGDLRDVYSLVHELTHTLDIDNGDTVARRILGEVAPQCMERMLDNFLVNMSQEDRQKYGFDFEILKEDINKRKLTTFISRYRNAISLNRNQGNNELDSRYMLAQIYSTKFIKYREEEQKEKIVDFIEHIKNNEFQKANNDFNIEISKQKSLQRGFLVSDCLDEANKIHDTMEIPTGKIKDLVNHAGKKFNLHCYKSSNEMYYLIAFPENFSENCNIVVESYNSGGKSKITYSENVIEALNNGNSIENLLMEAISDSPIVMPITMDIIDGNDTQQLSLESIKEDKIDFKFMQCIKDAQKKIEQISKKKVSEKIFLNGYSASGVFAQRFVLAYPEIIDSCLIGGAAGTIPIPSENLEYPLGIKDYEELFGKKFDEEAYKNIIFGYYVAENEEREAANWDINGDKIISSNQIASPMHDMSYRELTTPKEVGKKQRTLLGQTMNERYKNSIEYYKKKGINISGIILKGANHFGIFNSNINPSADYLKQQLIRFYYEGEPLEGNNDNCVPIMNENFQINRNNKNEKIK